MEVFQDLRNGNSCRKLQNIRHLNGFYGIFVILMFLLSSSLDVWARPTTVQEAKDIVAAWLAEDSTPLEMNLNFKIRECQAFKDQDGKSLYYVVYLAPKGIVLVSGDDWVEPIIGFAPEAMDYNPGDDNPLGALVNRDIPGRVQYARKLQSLSASKIASNAEGFSQGDVHRARWSKLLNASKVRSLSSEKMATQGLVVSSNYSDLSDVRVPGLVQSLWGQSQVNGRNCYNYYTPGNIVCGCVATAMAQVIRYHEWPKVGIGVNIFTVYYGMGYGEQVLKLATLGGDEGGGPYLWEYMPYDPQTITDADTFTTVCKSIGALCYDAGLSVGMHYDMNPNHESGASMRDTVAALKDTFLYADAVVGDPTSATWNIMLNSNLDASSPCMLSVYNQDSGHAIICDGYGYQAATLYHHLNMGWNGGANAWYNLPTLGSGDGSYYTSIDACIYNIFPEGTGQIISGRILNRWGGPMEGVRVDANDAVGATYSALTNSRGIYAIKHVPADTTFTLSAAKEGCTFAYRQVTTGRSSGAVSGNLWRGDCDFMEGLGYPQDQVGLTLNVCPDRSWGTLTVASPEQTYIYYQRGSVVTLSAAAAEGYRLKAWSGTDNDALTAGSNRVTMTGDKTVSVEFEKITEIVPTGNYTLTTSVIGDNGTIWPRDVRIYPAGSVVTVSCNPNAGYRVLRWTGTDDDSSTNTSNVVTMMGNKEVTVEFEVTPVYTLSAMVVGGHGTLGALLPTYPEGTSVAVTCSPETGYQIKRWTGTIDDSSKLISNAVKMTGDKVVTVEMEEISTSLGGSSDGGDNVPGDGGDNTDTPSAGFCTLPGIVITGLAFTGMAFLTQKGSRRSDERKK